MGSFSVSGRSSAGVLALALGLALVGCSDDAGGGTPAVTASRQGVDPGSSPTSAATARATPPATARAAPPPPVTATPSVAISTAPAVAMTEPAKLTKDVTVIIRRPRTVRVGAVPGEVAGAAVAVDVTVRNTGMQRFNLSGMVVTAAFGEDDVPGDTSSAEPSAPLTGWLPREGSRTGVYVFRIPSGARASTIKLQVSSDQSPTVIQFQD
jgi:hypothetical protein